MFWAWETQPHERRRIYLIYLRRYRIKEEPLETTTNAEYHYELVGLVCFENRIAGFEEKGRM